MSEREQTSQLSCELSYPLASILRDVQQFEHWTQTTNHDNDSWNAVIQKDPVYIDHNGQAWASEFDQAFIENIRLKTHHFTGSTPANYPQQHAACWLHEVLTQGLPTHYIYSTPALGGECGFEVTFHTQRIFVSDDTNAYQERLRQLYRVGVLDALPVRPTIVEIGGGFGGLANAIADVLVAEAKHGGRYIIIDLPNSLKFAYCWLRMNQRNVRFILSADDVALASSETEIDDAPTFWLVPSDNTPLLDSLSIDLAINTLSFTEMTRDIVSQYATFLRHGLAPHGVLFEQNNEYPQHQGTDYLCSTHEVLAPVFTHYADIEHCSLFGITRVWSPSEHVIHNIKKAQSTRATHLYAQSRLTRDIALPIQWAVFGAGKTGQQLIEHLVEHTQAAFEVHHLYDNDANKWQQRFMDKPIHSPQAIIEDITKAKSQGKHLLIILASYYYHDIYLQLSQLIADSATKQIIDVREHLLLINELEAL